MRSGGEWRSGLEEGLEDICLPALDSTLVSEVGQAFLVEEPFALASATPVQPRLSQQLDALASLNVTQGVLQDVQQETAETKLDICELLFNEFFCRYTAKQTWCHIASLIAFAFAPGESAGSLMVTWDAFGVVAFGALVFGIPAAH